MSQLVLVPDDAALASVPERGIELSVGKQPLAKRVSAGIVPYLLLAPAALTLIVWVYKPLLQTFSWSFYDWNLLPTSPKTWVGWDNYGDILALPDLWDSVKVTLWMMIGLLPFTLVIPTVAALFTQQLGRRAQSSYRAAVFIPVLITPVVTAAVWRWLLSTSGGFYQQPLELLGIEPVNWFREATPALVAVVVISGWKMLGFSTLLMTAGLSNIDASYLEAAEVDGASKARTLRRVTLPLLSPTLTFMGLMTVLLTAQWLFPLIQLLTQGGPSNSTTNVYCLLYQMGFSSFNVGLSSAAGVLFFICFGVLAVGCLRLMDRWSFYEGRS